MRAGGATGPSDPTRRRKAGERRLAPCAPLRAARPGRRRPAGPMGLCFPCPGEAAPPSPGPVSGPRAAGGAGGAGESLRAGTAGRASHWAAPSFGRASVFSSAERATEPKRRAPAGLAFACPAADVAARACVRVPGSSVPRAAPRAGREPEAARRLQAAFPGDAGAVGVGVGQLSVGGICTSASLQGAVNLKHAVEDSSVSLLLLLIAMNFLYLAAREAQPASVG